MKKRSMISVLTILVMSWAMLGCSNEEIQIDQLLTVKVTTSEVLSGFKFEIYKGELSKLTNDNYKLRTQLLVYNTEGKLVSQETHFLNYYGEDMTVHPSLPGGTYRMVAITDVVLNRQNLAWQLSGEADLSQLRLSSLLLGTGTDADKEAGRQNTILGAETKVITIDNKTKDIVMAPKALGALVCVQYKGIKKFSNLKQVQFRFNEKPEYASFDASGSITMNSLRGEQNQLPYLEVVRPKNEPSDLVTYIFLFPSDVTMGFAYALDGDQQAKYAGGKFTEKVEAGIEYIATVDFDAIPSLTIDPVVSFTIAK